MTDEHWIRRATSGVYRATDLPLDDKRTEYAVEGLMPRTGATIWFGAGSTGKTQLLLWLAAHIAAVGDDMPQKWLGADVRVRGHVLVLTAEDLREHILQRIGSIARRMMHEAGCEPEGAAALCERIHVMAFLSMTTTEFNEPNPSLFTRGTEGLWEPSAVLNGIERFLDDWNRNAATDDQIVGVILDSAVSMAGFEMTNSEATTNFLFYLNRLARRQEMFWAVIGHTPKDAAKRTDDAAIERLRGSAMWSTTPRTVVEVRLAGAAEDLESVREVYPGLDDRSVVIVQVAKANSQGADLEPRALLRRSEGAYDHITPEFPGIFRKRQAASGTRRSAHTPELRDAVIALLGTFDGGKPGTTIEREQLRTAFIEAQPTSVALTAISDAVTGASSKKPGTLAYELAGMTRDQVIDTRRGNIKIVDLYRTGERAVAESSQ